MNDRDEWRAAVDASTDLEQYLAVHEPRWAIGLTGDKDDARNE